MRNGSAVKVGSLTSLRVLGSWGGGGWVLMLHRPRQGRRALPQEWGPQPLTSMCPGAIRNSRLPLSPVTSGVEQLIATWLWFAHFVDVSPYTCWFHMIYIARHPESETLGRHPQLFANSSCCSPWTMTPVPSVWRGQHSLWDALLEPWSRKLLQAEIRVIQEIPSFAFSQGSQFYADHYPGS